MKNLCVKMILFFFLLMGSHQAGATKQEKLIDLGVAGVDSSIEGAQYLRGIQESLESKLGRDAFYLEFEVIKEIEKRHRHLMRTMNREKKSES